MLCISWWEWLGLTSLELLPFLLKTTGEESIHQRTFSNNKVAKTKALTFQIAFNVVKAQNSLSFIGLTGSS